MCNDLEDGGVKVVDMNSVQESMLLAWAEKLIAPDKQQWKSLAIHFFKDLGGVTVFRSKVTANQFKGFYLIASTFWTSVLRSWLEHSGNDINSTYSLYDSIFNKIYRASI